MWLFVRSVRNSFCPLYADIPCTYYTNPDTTGAYLGAVNMYVGTMTHRDRLRNISRDTSTVWFRPGLPDGIFSNQKSQFGKILGRSCNGRCWYIVWPFGQFSGHLVYYMSIWYILWSFGAFSPF
jgi:hypothetical protein